MAKLDLPTVPLVAEHNAPIPMRDGTLLRADLYRPARGGPFPNVWPDGRAMGVADGIVRARYRDRTGQPVPITPGAVHEYAIDLIATSQPVKAGRRVRVDIASSNFPCFDRNPGNGAPAATATERDFVAAEQTICHDAGHPSASTLPVIPRG